MISNDETWGLEWENGLQDETLTIVFSRYTFFIQFLENTSIQIWKWYSRTMVDFYEFRKHLFQPTNPAAKVCPTSSLRLPVEAEAEQPGGSPVPHGRSPKRVAQEGMGAELSGDFHGKLGFLWDFHGISMGFLWDLHGISSYKLVYKPH